MNIIAKPFGYVMQFCAKLCMNNYALALLLFALIVKLVLLPFGIKQQSTQVKAAKLRPKVAAIEKKYAGRTDRPTLQKKQQEIMELQQKEGVSPFGGCLPLLIQFPILIGLYNVIRNPFSYLLHKSGETIGKIAAQINFNPDLIAKHTSAEGVINYQKIGSAVNQLDLVPAVQGAERTEALAELVDVSAIPDFTLFGLDLSQTPQNTFGWLLLIPIFAGVMSYLTMWLSRKLSGTAQMMGNTDAQKSNLIMDLLMPLISAYISYIYPAMLGIYWAYQSLFGLAQSLVLAKLMPLPKFTPEDLKRAEKEMKVEEVKRKPVQIRSLHHIDDDEEDAPAPILTGTSSVYGDEDEEEDTKGTASNSIAPAPIKQEDDRPSKKKKTKSSEND